MDDASDLTSACSGQNVQFESCFSADEWATFVAENSFADSDTPLFDNPLLSESRPLDEERFEIPIVQGNEEDYKLIRGFSLDETSQDSG